MPLPASHLYRLHGLQFESAERVPGLAPWVGPILGETVEIRFGSVPTRLAEVEVEDEIFQANAVEFLLSWPDTARILACGGRCLTVDPEFGCDPVQLWNVVLNTGASIAGFQRGHVPLHASSVVTPTGAVALAGRSGVGKSTLTAALMERGLPLFTDDLCLVRCDEDGSIVGGGVPELRLWADAIEKLGWSSSESVGVQATIPKFIFRRPEAQSRDMPLRRIYALGFSGNGLDAGIRRLQGIQAMQVLVDRMRLRMDLLPTTGRRAIFEGLVAIAAQVEIFQFIRPNGYDHFEVWLDALTDHIAI